MTTNPFVGQIIMVGFTFAPPGWELCNGQLIPIQQNSALFSLLGTAYGGNGVTTFALPDLRGRFPLHAHDSRWEFNLGRSGGEENVTLTTQQLPYHAHTLPAAAGQTTDRPAGAAPAQGGSYGSVASGINMVQSGPTGGGMAHNNMPPYLPVNFIIATQGVFPPRP
ncbi:phage tail protein [Arthrobacter sp. 7Tela_A1]|uniref:phage tail protein n=1 Tax=Arthrobacter sp. 7Tela_A1 TaxID=3093745 RepID=UPI003BB53B25